MNKKLIIKNAGLILISIILVSIDIYHKDFTLTLILIYGLFIKFLLSSYVKGKVKKGLEIFIWIGFLVSCGLTYSANHLFPKGPMYSTGDVVCQYEDRGPCAEEYREDTRNLNVPEWVKFFKDSESFLLWCGLLLAGIIISYKDKKE